MNDRSPLTANAEPSRATSATLPFGVALGSLWATLAFARGATLMEFLVLSGGAATSLVLARVTFVVLRSKPQHARRLLVSLALGALLLTAFAYALALRTHHRPLAAATFSVFGTAALAAIGVCSTRVLIPRGIAWAVVAVLFLSVCGAAVGTGERAFFTLLEIALGVLAVCGMVLLPGALKRAIPPAMPKIALLLLVSSWLLCVLTPVGAGAAQKAPILAGLLGLLS